MERRFMAKQELRVVYDGTINTELDAVLRAVLRGFGYHCWASGHNHEDDKRDLAFERETNADED